MGSGLGQPEGRGSSGSVRRGKKSKSVLTAGGMRRDDIGGGVGGFGVVVVAGVGFLWWGGCWWGGMTKRVIVDHSVGYQLPVSLISTIPTANCRVILRDELRSGTVLTATGINVDYPSNIRGRLRANKSLIGMYLENENLQK